MLGSPRLVGSGHIVRVTLQREHLFVDELEPPPPGLGVAAIPDNHDACSLLPERHPTWHLARAT